MRLLGCLVLLLSACTSIKANAPGEVLGRGYSIDGVTWRGGGAVYVFVRTKELNGQVAVCGAWSADLGAVWQSTLNAQILSAGRVVLGGDTVVHGLDFMNELPWTEEENGFVGKPTNCVVTDAVWLPGFEAIEPDVDFPRMRFVI